MKMKKILEIFIFCLLLSSCGNTWETFREDILRPLNLWQPTPFGIGEVPKGGSPEFTQGWEDGCHSGISAYGGTHYRNLGYKFKQDYKMIHNKDYYNAWQDAYLYCRWYVWNYIRQGSVNSVF